MAKVYITEHTYATVRSGQPVSVVLMPPIATQVATTSGSSQQLTFNASTRLIRIHTDGIISVEFGSSPTATTNSARMPAGATEYFEVQPSSKIALITNT